MENDHNLNIPKNIFLKIGELMWHESSVWILLVGTFFSDLF